jgi:UDP-N-acetyl-2-amino-2-deoxyglucuronate dehydrogenase
VKKLKVALVGCGTIAKGHYLLEIPRMENAELVAICDNVPSQLEYAAKTFNIAKAYASVDKMLDEVDCDVVVDTASIPSHFDINLKALQAGKHLYSQKPLATTVEGTTILIEAARARNLKISASPIHMLRGTIRRIKEMVASGVVGKVAFARLHSSHGGPEYYQRTRLTSPAWFYEPDAGPLLDLGVHGLHTITGILGPAKEVTCMSGISEKVRIPLGCGGDSEGKPFDVKIDDNTLLMLNFGNSTFAFLDSTYCIKAYEGPNLEIYGSRGTISSSREPQSIVRLFRALPDDGGPAWVDAEMPEERRFQSVGVEDLLNAIQEDRPTVLTPEHARHVVEIMNKCYVAAREKRTMPLETTF